MIKTILVPCSGNDADAAGFRAGLDVARAFGAHLQFLHVRPDAAEFAAALSGDGAAMLSANLIDHLEAEADAREKKAKQMFDRFAKAEKLPAAPKPNAVSASFSREVGREGDWVADYGRTADLTVICRPGATGESTRDTLEAALLHSGRPLLIPAEKPFKLGTVAIAWKSTREAAHATALAAPFLVGAKRIVVMTAAEGDRKDSSAARLAGALRRVHKSVDLRELKKSPAGAGAALLAAAAEEKADLLVMGGYGHTRMREWVFGGVTEHMLKSATLPVLMAH